MKEMPHIKAVKGDSGSKNLLSEQFSDKMILIMDVGYVSDAVKGVNELKSLSRISNVFVLPEVVPYKDYINTGYDALMRRQKNAKKK